MYTQLQLRGSARPPVTLATLDKMRAEGERIAALTCYDASFAVLLDRIGRRGIRYEQYIERAYLERLNAAYARFFHEFDGAPLLIVNAAAIDPLHNESDYEELLAAIRRMQRGRLYYNPLRHAAL